MTKEHQVVKCTLCGNVVEVLHAGSGARAYRGEDMALLAEFTIAATPLTVREYCNLHGVWKA